jgi:hypothetical protein
MAHGKIRVNTLTYDTGSGDVDVAVSGIPTASAIAGKADSANAQLTGVPVAPTAASGTNTTQIATTAFVAAAVPTIDPDTAKTDVAQTFTAGQRGTITELTAGTSFDLNFASSNNFLIQPNGTFTVTLNATGLSGSKGQCGSIFIKYQSGATTSGSFPTTMKFVGGAAGITLTGTGIDRIDYIVQDDTSGSEVITCNVTNNYVA